MTDLITDHMDIWTGAQIQKANGGRGRGKNGNGQPIYGIKKLRELILELAVRGKLVPQDPDDEPASVLLDRIAEERKRLIQEGKIKKQRELAEIGEDEKPFELPEGWEWTRFVTISYQITDGTHHTPTYVSKGVPFLSVKDISSGFLDFSKTRFISKEQHEDLTKRCNPQRGDLLLTKVGTTGIPVLIDNDKIFSIFVSVALIKFNQTQISGNFLSLMVNSPLVKNQSKEGTEGIGNKNLVLRKIAAFAIVIPPLAEQHRIVTKVDELMALCDQLEQQQTDNNATHQTLVETLLTSLTTATDQKGFDESWQRIANHFDTLFTTEQSIDHLKQAILQLAVMGRLVTQDPDDEPASVLLKKIAKEKARLVKEGEVKNEKALPPVNTDSAPFDLPQGWAWARFPEVGEFGRGKSKHRPRNDPSLYSAGKYPMVQTGDVARANGIVKTYTALYNAEGLSQSRLWPKGTMCITIAANIADSSILGLDACFPDSVVGLIPSVEIGDARYFEYFMRTAKAHLMDFAPSTAQKNINLGILKTVYIPLPPANEIKRIVDKVDELMTICDTLKTRFNDAQTTQVQLADAIVEQAVG